MTELRTLIDSAYHTAKQGYYKDALDEFRFVLSSDPTHREALYGAAACAFRLGQHDLAEDFVSRILKKFPKDAQALALRERVAASDYADAEEQSKDIIQRMREEAEDPFGVGSDKKITEVIPEWRAIEVTAPTFVNLLAYGKEIEPGRLNIFSAYAEAARLYRSGFKQLVWAGWFALFIQVGFLACAISLFSGWLVWLEDQGTAALALTLFIANVIVFAFYPLLAVHTQFCYRWKRDPETKASDQLRYVEKYPYVFLTAFWVFGPGIFLWVFLKVGLLALPISPGGMTLKGGVGLVFLLFQLLVYLRSWFIHLVIFDEEIRPLAAVSKAYYLTRKQPLKTILFIAFQTLLFPIAVLPLGIGYPFLCLAQVAAFDQLNPPKEEPEEGEEQ